MSTGVFYVYPETRQTISVSLLFHEPVDAAMSFFEGLFGPARLWRVENRLLGLFVLGLAASLWGAASAVGQQDPVPQGATVELVADGFEFTEGPLWYEGALLFSDIPANTVYRWTPKTGTSVFLKPSGHANGLALAPNGDLLLAQHDGQVGRHTENGTVTPLVDAYGGRRLNSPNDLTIASDRTIYFTDPPYGVDEERRRLDFSGVYRVSPEGTLTLLTKQLARPNGICLSPNDSTLYVSDSKETRVWAYDVTSSGTLENGRPFAAPRNANADGTTDGMTIDAEGNLYTTGPGGVWVYAPNAQRLARIAVPKPPTNLAFGGPDRKTLYVTAQSHVYRVSVAVPGTQ